MDWRSEYETNRAILCRIVAMLFTLADLAQRADSMPDPIRWLVIWTLRPAERIAREFVFERLDCGDARDAGGLARTFRTLALALRNTLRQLRRTLSCCAVRDVAGARKGHRRPVSICHRLVANGTAFAPHPDTS